MKPSDISIFFQPDGTILIPRGTKEQNDIARNLLENVVDRKEIEGFFALTDKSELIFGNTTHCG